MRATPSPGNRPLDPDQRGILLIELVIQSLAYAKASSKVELSNADLADTFRRWTGAADGANVFLVENPYRIKAHMLYPS